MHGLVQGKRPPRLPPAYSSVYWYGFARRTVSQHVCVLHFYPTVGESSLGVMPAWSCFLDPAALCFFFIFVKFLSENRHSWVVTKQNVPKPLLALRPGVGLNELVGFLFVERAVAGRAIMIFARFFFPRKAHMVERRYHRIAIYVCRYSSCTPHFPKRHMAEC